MSSQRIGEGGGRSKGNREVRNQGSCCSPGKAAQPCQAKKEPPGEEKQKLPCITLRGGIFLSHISSREKFENTDFFYCSTFKINMYVILVSIEDGSSLVKSA